MQLSLFHVRSLPMQELPLEQAVEVGAFAAELPAITTAVSPLSSTTLLRSCVACFVGYCLLLSLLLMRSPLSPTLLLGISQGCGEYPIEARKALRPHGLRAAVRGEDWKNDEKKAKNPVRYAVGHRSENRTQHSPRR